MTKTLFAICSSLIVIAACTASKKSKTSTASTTTTVTTTTTVATTKTLEATETPAILAPSVKTWDGVYPPGNEELAAIQLQYKDATLDKLKEGYFIYSEGACTKCHGNVNIYHIDPFRWGYICDDMAMKANLTQNQKEAVYQYVLAIKATKDK